ncbi:3'(2'),5'-bisphosphate nucleotidase CysQ [Aestuariicoccus sp. MJ-SS9]|uniref:3'(2'),5'-bisphosphate nucleotidase CysQ n=1 Tax=Aestuariicoccus sp. MJ-SS9 TaxID=3079855 RepID=UPI002909D76B|nr:3'(2'),5'-bisphosphate nucleotidase CysQ [Aestuariicoccus sp. MJ-SS9]MDU8911350.1 3'(2'),5'-bisphosphate nucleotidase CysQ [Aestuariicoccus sp. MJ-SS9]
MPESDLALLTRAAHAAAEVATTFVGGPLDVRHKDDGQGPVTAADLAVNDVLATLLRGARPDYGWLSEESADTADRLTRREVFIVDPIDGTRSFVEGSDTWAHSLAVARDGVVTAAVVYLPLRGKLYAASVGGGARLNDEPVRVAATPEAAQAHVLATRPSLDPRHWRGQVPAFRRSHRPSLAYRLSLVAEGRYDAMFTFRPSWEWDIAAGTLILEEAGAATSDRTGQPLRFNNPVPQTAGVVAANPALHADILRHL